MRISNLINQPIVIVGAGREGLATMKLLHDHGHRAEILVLGDQPTEALPYGAKNIDAETLSDTLTSDHIVIRSPGFSPHHPLRVLIDQSNAHQTTATRLMLAELNAAAISVIGVTASKGKSTTSSLLTRMLIASGQATQLVGNIGIPALSALGEILDTRPLVVMEMSSYQCDDLMPGEGPSHVVFGRLFPEHLDWHGSLAHYYKAKTQLLLSMPSGGRAWMDHHAIHTLRSMHLVAGLERTDIHLTEVNLPSGYHFTEGSFFEGKDRICTDHSMLIPGQHNRDNACLAYAAAHELGCDQAAFERTISRFSGLPYRLEREGIHAGIDWINDSISTAPEAACAALEAFGIGGTYTLIVGGQDRGYDYLPLIQSLSLYQVQQVILLPESGPTIGQLSQAHPNPSSCSVSSQFHTVSSLAEAVKLAADLTPEGQRCVFSPAAPSYHAWSGFEARGQDFRNFIQDLTEMKRS